MSEKTNFTLTFNQDITSLSCGTSKGFRLYNLGRVPEALDLLYNSASSSSTNSSTKNVTSIQRLFTSSLVAYVCDSQKNRLYLTHFRKNSIICDHQYNTDIVSVQLNRNRLIVVLDDNSIHIHAIKDMSLIHTLKDCIIPAGACPKSSVALAAPLSASALSNLIAYPTSAEKGQVTIFDAYLLRTIKIIEAHDNPISAMAFANNSSFRAGSQDNPLFLATASNRGTVIRVWAIPTGNCIKELRRGMYTAEIRQLNFSMDARFLTLISNTQTVHIFDLNSEDADETESGSGSEKRIVQVTDEELENEPDIDNSWYTYLTGLVGGMLSLTSSYMDSAYNVTTGGVIERAKTSCKIPADCQAQAVAIMGSYVLVACTGNKLLVYSFDRKSSSTDECRYLKEFDLNDETQQPILNHANTNQNSTSSSYSSVMKTRSQTKNNKQQQQPTIDVDLKEVKNNGDEMNAPDIDDPSQFPALF